MFQVCRNIFNTLIIYLISYSIAVAAEEGKDYEKLSSSVLQHQDVKQLFTGAGADKKHVLEFFSYACYWCSKVHSPFQKWATKKSNKVKVAHYPVMFNRMWSELGRLYYVSNHFDNTGKLDHKIFDAIHLKGQRLWLKDGRKNFILENGFSEEEFNSTFNSFIVSQKISRANELARVFGVSATPIIIVASKNSVYMTNLVKTKTVDKLLKTVDYLLEL